MPAFRPYWKGFLKLSLVSCPIALFPAATAADRMSFRQVNRKTGNRLRHKLIDAVTGEDVAVADKARGYEVGENSFVFVEDQEIAQARNARPLPGALALQEEPVPLPAKTERFPERRSVGGEEEEIDEWDGEIIERTVIPRTEDTHTIEIECFLPAGQIDSRYYEKPYYIVPRELVGQEAFAVIRDALRKTRMSGLGRVVLSSRERPFLLEPMGNGLRGSTLRFSHEVRGEADYFDSIPQMRLPPETLKLAEHIIQTKAADFDASMLEDHYRNALAAIVRKKQLQPHAPVAPVAPSRENVVNLMEALRKSLAQSGKKAKPKKRIQGQRELLLPISGSAQKPKPTPRAMKVRRAG